MYVGDKSMLVTLNWSHFLDVGDLLVDYLFTSQNLIMLHDAKRVLSTLSRILDLVSGICPKVLLVYIVKNQPRSDFL